MDSRTTANLYYDAWRTRAGDMTGVPLAEDFTFTGPVASFATADGFRAMAAQAGAAVRDFRVRHQFADGNLVCSVIDWEMAPLPGVLTAAEVLEIRDGTIVRGELIYDAEQLRKASPTRPPSPTATRAPKPIADLVVRSLRDTAQMLGKIDSTGWAAPSPCEGWTVRQAGNHLVGSLTALVRIVEGETLAPAELDPGRMADIDHLGADPATSVAALAQRARARFADPETLGRVFDQPAPEVPGMVIANIALLESLVHGWDVATGAGVGYQPDQDVVKAVHDFATAAVGDAQRQQGLFGPAVRTPEDADPLTATLGHLGRHSS